MNARPAWIVGEVVQTLSLARHEMAKREVNRWFDAEWQKLLAEKGAREREIERKFWNGDYSR